MIITVPVVLMIRTGRNKKTKKDKFSNALNLNFYRNAHYIFNDRAKKQFKEIIAPQVRALDVYTKLKPTYRYYLARKADMGNVHSVVEKYFLDAIVEFGKIGDDDCYQVIGGDYEFVEVDKENARCEIELKEVKHGEKGI